mmetsp:Transcript_31519/g.35849  ORF Transcript_31519/g.35849 Transcript_31519/m.35849 type:complete len:145 (+) Transcript_31519:76-510(+)|eukprot:CAMPEP_0194133366 /NCGR_PEP_ID=MMETSP0152-20130528/3574_1 /TAXON_ID=1049557 /ORGANISM="Thalassiothrix antarctica, Strain L6-D1" /LENGTH=144 /DNA_ID=CAMNT_0038828675 /DNA_START=81 /DNA_END=515 /DNA_ORIENTATION=-
MGGGNGQKSAAARAKKLEKAQSTKSPEERKAALAKVNADRNGFLCKICKATFMINVPPPQLFVHVSSKHAECMKCPEQCFDVLEGFDPEDPKGLKKAAAEKAAAAKKEAIMKKKNKKNEVGLEDLFSVGLTKGKNKKKAPMKKK